MTQVITRYFDNAATLPEVIYELATIRRFPLRIIDSYDSAEGLVERLAAQGVETSTAEAYRARMVSAGGAVLLVRAGSKPLGVARMTREITAAMGAVDMGGLIEETYVRDLPQPVHSVLRTHPLLLTKKREPGNPNIHMANWPIPLISRRKPSDISLFPRHMRMASFPVPLKLPFEYRPFTASIFPRHARMANFPIPLISRRKPFTGSMFPRHARMANFPLPLISRRKPRDRFWIPRHGRMATVPFPLLINGKQGGNALMPGAPRMANFPIPLLSRRKPFTASIFPRHARMARFPIGLISRRKPFTGSIIGRHARMANFPLPLVVDRDGPGGFSFSKLLGWSTVTKRG